MDEPNIPIFKALEAAAAQWEDVPFSREGWSGAFPENGIETPLGWCDVKPEMLKSHATDAGLSLFGALRPCLERPSYVLTPEGPDGPVEFYRAFTGPGGFVGGYVCARVGDGAVSVAVSEQPASFGERVAAVPVWTALDAVPLPGEDAVMFKGLFAPGVVVTDFELALACLGIDPMAKAMQTYRASHEPSEAQLKAGNYAKRRMGWNGLTLVIENEAGSVRRGRDGWGVEWETRMLYPYGYVAGTEGVDGDEVDVFVGPNEDAPEVFIIRQMQAGDWERYDEDKVMLGFASVDEAVQAFLRHYDDARFLGNIQAMPVAEFVAKVQKTQGDMLKSQPEAAPAGSRWITVHPNGEGTKGVPVLVQETQHGSGVFHVIGGAGGKLNYLKLRGVKSEGEYKADAAEKAKAKREKKAEQDKADKEAGIYDAKQAARSDLKDQKTQAEREYIQTVADAMGWSEVKDGKVKLSDDLTGEALKKAEKDAHAELVKRCHEAVQLQRSKLVADADARAAAGLGEIPFEAGPDALSVEDLNPVRVSEGTGIEHSFKERAEANGLTDEKLDAAVAAVEGADDAALLSQTKAAAAVAKGEAGEAIAEQLDAAKPDLKPKIAEAKQAVAMLVAHKKMKALAKQYAEAKKDIDAAHVEPKAYVLKVSDVSADDVAKDVEEDIRTAAAKSLLGEAEAAGGHEALEGHVFTGAHAAINALSQAVAGASLIDRSVVDVLGVAGAAQVMARRLHGAYGADEANKVADAVAQYHADTQAGRVQEALAEAKELQDAAAELQMEEAEGSADLVAACEISRKRKQALVDARKAIGNVLGQMEAAGAMVQALRESPRDSVQVSLGATSPESAIRQLYALGLTANDFELSKEGGNVFAVVKSSGMDKLAQSPDHENMARVQRNLAIQRGEYDEDNWLPQGFANRPDLALKGKPGVATKLGGAMDWGNPDKAAALREYVGGRIADGDSPADVLAAIHSEEFHAKGGDGYAEAVAGIAPMSEGIEAVAKAFDAIADAHVEAKYGQTRSALNKQSFEADDKAQDALHRALSSEPTGVAAYKPVGELSSQDEAALKGWFAKNHDGADWGEYAKAMGGKVKAFEAVQDLVRSRVSEEFARHFNTLNPEQPLAIGKTLMRGGLNHAMHFDAKAGQAKVEAMRALAKSMKDGVPLHTTEAAYFGASEGMPGAGERNTVGHAAEAKIAAMMGIVGKNFEPGKPVKLFQPTMSGKDGAKRQRAIKLVEANERVILGAGVGSGKTAMGLGAFAHLHTKGNVKKGLFVVPSIVQGQFGAEALRFLKAGQFDWHCEPGGSYEDRLAAYKNPGKHFAVVTHQSFRDDVLRMASEAGHGSPEEVTAKMDAMTKEARAAFTKSVLDHHGIAWDYIMADEAHGLLNRDGKENSGMSNAIEGVTDNARYYVHASGDPVKNDASEAFSLLQKMDGARYNDREAFMRRYGGDTRLAKEGLQREMARHLYAMRIKPDIEAKREVKTVPLSDGQKAALADIEQHAGNVRLAKLEGKSHVESAKALSPSMFEGVPESEHEAVAKRVADSVGILKETAIKRVLNNHAEAAKLDEVVKHAAARKGKQGVVFARSLAAVESIRARLELEGHKVTTITGKDSSGDKAAKIQKFNPDKGDPEADIIVCSDAGATGANLQSGQWLLQYDTPDTAMTHAQRQGRIDRVGQKNNVELTDLVADHESERRARNRLATKYGLRDLMTSPLEGLDDSGLAYYLKQAGIGQPQQGEAK